MWKWLKAVAEVDRLSQENLALKKETADLRTKLFEEIDSNREREDALVQVIASGRTPVQETATRRSILSLAPIKTEEEEPEIPELVFDDYSEEMVAMRARDYMAEAAKSGATYDFDELCKAIRANPREFLSN